MTDALLASLGTREGVTTNYDPLFEIAAQDQSSLSAVLPFYCVGLGQRWLLKLHGSVERPESIVFTLTTTPGLPRATAPCTNS